MKDTKVELLKCINLTNVICSIPIFIYVLVLKMELQVALTTIIIYEIIYLLIKSFFIIGINNNVRDNSILILISPLDFKLDMKIFNNLKNMTKESYSNIECNINYVDNWIYNFLLYGLHNNIIKLLYNYNYIVKLEITSSVEDEKNVISVYSNIGICNTKNNQLEKVENKFAKEICNEKRKIYENNLLNSIEQYNDFLIPILQFIVATILPVIKEENIYVSERILENIISKSKKELNIINKLSRNFLSQINYYKYCKMTESKVVYTTEEINTLTKYVENMYKYTGETFDYNNLMAIISFYKREKKTTILRYLERAKRLSRGVSERIVIELNFAFIYFYYREYSKGIAKYKNNLLKLIQEKNITQEEKNKFINEIRDFINNIEEDRIVVGCDMARIFINSCDKEVGTLAEQQLAGLASNSEYIKLSSDIREKFETEIKNLIYKKDISK